MKCFNCGYDNPEGAGFCARCGANLHEEAPSSRPSWNVKQGPRWADPDFSADSVSEDDVPDDFVSEYSAPKLDSVEGRRQAAEAAAERARAAAENAAAKKAAEEQRAQERRSIEEERARERRAAEESRIAGEYEIRGADSTPIRDEELEAARDLFSAEQRNIRRANEQAYDDEEDDFDDDLEPAHRPNRDKGLVPFVTGIFKHKEKARPTNEYNDDYDEEDDYEPRPAKKKTGIRGLLSNKKAMNTAIRIAALVAALAVLALLVFGIVKLAKSCSNANSSPLGTNKVPTIEVNPEDETTYFVTVYAKEGKVLVYETADGSRKEVTVPASGFVKFRVPVSSLMPGEAVEGSTYQATPKVYIKNDDGTETLIDGYEPAYVMLQIPAINIEFDNPDTIVSDDGSVEIKGHIDLIATVLTVNGESVPVNADGSFSHIVKYEEAGDYVINAEAKLSGHQVYRHSFNVTVTKATTTETLIQLPWEYGDNAFSQRVKNSVDTIEVQGRAPAGSSVTVSCGSQNATLTTPSVNDDGSFSFKVTMAYAGDYELLIQCTTTDGRMSERIMHVQRAPEWTSYVGGAMTMNYASFAYATSQAYKISGTVTAIIQEGDFILAELTISDGNTLILQYHNHYGSAGTLTVGQSYSKIYGRPMGLNEDGVPQIYVWFVDD